MKETLKEANYKYEKYLGEKCHLLKDLDTGKLKMFVSNKYHASWGLIWKNTHLEFVR